MVYHIIVVCHNFGKLAPKYFETYIIELKFLRSVKYIAINCIKKLCAMANKLRGDASNFSATLYVKVS